MRIPTTVSLFSHLMIILVWSSQPSLSEAQPRMGNLLGAKDKDSGVVQPLRERKLSPHTWLIQHPFDGGNPQSLGPPLNENDPDKMEPVNLPEAPERGEARLSAILYQRCIDADTCILKIPGDRNTEERELRVKLLGIDVPHVSGQCEQEKAFAEDAINLLDQALSEAVQIDLYDHYDAGLHHEARLVADGQDLSQLLLNQGLAVPHQRERKEWCID